MDEVKRLFVAFGIAVAAVIGGSVVFAQESPCLNCDVGTVEARPASVTAEMRCPGDVYCFSYGFYWGIFRVPSGGRSIRIKAMSDVFGYCYWDYVTGTITSEGRARAIADIQGTFGVAPTLVVDNVRQSESREDANRDRERQAAESGYDRIITTSYVWAAYSSKCHS